MMDSRNSLEKSREGMDKKKTKKRKARGFVCAAFIYLAAGVDDYEAETRTHARTYSHRHTHDTIHGRVDGIITRALIPHKSIGKWRLFSFFFSNSNSKSNKKKVHYYSKMSMRI